MTERKHHSITLHIPGWHSATARMPRMVKSVFFDICLYTWEHAVAVPDSALVLMLADTGPQGDQIVAALVKEGTLLRDDEGNVWSEWALVEARKAFVVWEKRSGGGRARAALLKDSGDTPALPPAAPALAPPVPDKEPEKPPVENKPKRISTAACAEVFAAWNAAAKPLGLSIAQKMTGAREGAIRARLESEGLERITAALDALPDCRFLLGNNDRKWKADLDFFVRPNTITRILEGKYRAAGGGASAWRDME